MSNIAELVEVKPVIELQPQPVLQVDEGEVTSKSDYTTMFSDSVSEQGLAALFSLINASVIGTYITIDSAKCSEDLRNNQYLEHYMHDYLGRFTEILPEPVRALMVAGATMANSVHINSEDERQHKIMIHTRVTESIETGTIEEYHTMTAPPEEGIEEVEVVDG